MTTKDTINPTDGQVIKTYTVQTDQEARAVVEAADTAFKAWRKQDVKARADVIRRTGEVLRERADELATLMSTEMGKLVSQSRSEIELCAAICDWTADNVADELADETRELDGGRAIVTYQPIGVILGIQPWNFPLYQAMRYSIPQLAAGNTVLLKHASNVWGTAEALADIYAEAGVPEGAFGLLKVGHEQIPDIIAMPEVRGVTLTGSVKAGASVGAEAGKNLKKSVLELGSNDAYLVLSDADIDLAVKVGVMGRTFNNGETCVAAKRFVVVDAVYDQFRDAFVEQMGALVSGDPLGEDADLGPMARSDLRDTLHEQVQESVAAGATLSVGGTIPDGEGFHYPATVLEDVVPGMPAYDDELFGPVASLIRVSDDAEAMRVANDSRFGLGGGIFSADVERAVELARTEFDTGMVNVNGYHLAQPNLPFGGVKDSGYGREHGGFGLHEFVNVKAVMVRER